MPKVSKKPTLALITPLLMAGVSIKDILRLLDRILYIYYLVWFKKKIQALINLSSKINIITLVYILKLGLKACYINVRALKIDGSIFKTFEIILTSFQVKNKPNWAWYFQKMFLLANTNVEVILKILFLIFSNANIQFIKKKLI